MWQNMHGVIATSNKFGHLDIFLTMRCNPKWPRISRVIFPETILKIDLTFVLDSFASSFDQCCHLSWMKRFLRSYFIRQSDRVSEEMASACTLHFRTISRRKRCSYASRLCKRCHLCASSFFWKSDLTWCNFEVQSPTAERRAESFLCLCKSWKLLEAIPKELLRETGQDEGQF